MMPAWWPHLWQDDDRFFMMVRHGVLKLPGLDGLTFAIENDIGKAVRVARSAPSRSTSLRWIWTPMKADETAGMMATARPCPQRTSP
jgi:hypothetical protein